MGDNVTLFLPDFGGFKDNSEFLPILGTHTFPLQLPVERRNVLYDHRDEMRDCFPCLPTRRTSEPPLFHFNPTLPKDNETNFEGARG